MKKKQRLKKCCEYVIAIVQNGYMPPAGKVVIIVRNMHKWIVYYDFGHVEYWSDGELNFFTDILQLNTLYKKCNVCCSMV